MAQRDNAWLNQRLGAIWQQSFSDVEYRTPIKIHFGRRTTRRLGSIILRPHQDPDKEYSLITISGTLSDLKFPEFVIDHVIAHELVHYVHGFGSRLPRHLKHPHQGGVIVKEFQNRGLWELFRVNQAWMKLHWIEHLNSELE